MGEKPDNSVVRETEHGETPANSSAEPQHSEKGVTEENNLVYDDVEEEPEIHWRTWVAIASMFILNLVQVVALQGPPAVLSYIGTGLDNSQAETWIPNSLTLVQAVVGPLISSASDTFQARKFLLVGTSVISFVGAAIAPGSQNIYRLIAAQVLIGFGFASVPLAYSVPSEILPRRWRPMAQAGMNIAASLGAMVGPLIIGAMTKADLEDGWRNFYWVQMALWGVTAIGIFAGYRPPKRHTRLDHLSFLQKLAQLDLIGFALLTIGLTLLLTGLNLGGGLFSWTNARVLALLIIGNVFLIAFGVYEWKGTKTGILHHELFRGGKAAGRTFAICISLIFIEGILVFSYVIFFPVMTTQLFEPDPFLLTVRLQPFWVGCLLTTVVWGYWSTKRRTIRSPMLVGFVLFTAGIVGFATIEPGDSTNSIVFAALSGIGFGSPLVLVITGVQLSTPHHLIATATAVTTSSRAVAASVFTAIYAAAFSTRIGRNLPNYVAQAATEAGLSASNIPAFLGAFTTQDDVALAAIPGVNPAVIGAAVVALRQAFADSLRVVYIIAVPFGAIAVIACIFLGDMRKTMNYRIDAPVEDVTAKRHKGSQRPGGTAA